MNAGYTDDVIEMPSRSRPGRFHRVTVSVCRIDGCETQTLAKGLCCKHYERVRKHGDPSKGDPRPAEDRFWALVERTEACWLWTGAKNKSGYGVMHNKQSPRLAHRFSFEIVNGQIPAGLVIDHMCQTRACVRPEHLRAVSPQINSLENNSGMGARHASSLYCGAGLHLKTETSMYVNKKGDRQCRACDRERWQRNHLARITRGLPR